MTHQRPEESPRPLTDLERSYIARLLSAQFPGREEVEEQLKSALARRIDYEGSVEIIPTSRIRAVVSKRIPVEGEASDVDGVPIYFLLHVVDATVRELEIYKADGSPIRRMPTPEQIDVVVLPP
jgi:hypothetical protein